MHQRINPIEWNIEDTLSAEIYTLIHTWQIILSTYFMQLITGDMRYIRPYSLKVYNITG